MDPQANISVVVDTDTAYGREVLRGVSAYAHEIGRWLMRVRSIRTVWDGFPEASEAGLLVQSLDLGFSQRLKDSGKPTVNIGDRVWGHPLPSVISDHRQIGATAAQYLLTRGFTQLGFVGNQGHWYAEQRRDGFVGAARAAGCIVSECWVLQEPASRVTQPWLRDLTFPAGVLAAHDGLARSLAYDCRILGIDIPSQVAIIGVDNDVVQCESAPVTLSSVAIAAQRIGYEAAALLDRLLAGDPPPGEPILVPPSTVVPRHSTDTLAVDDPYVTAALHYIQANLAQRLNVDQLAQHLGVSRRYLQQSFRRVLGRPPVAEIRLARVQRAKELLASTDMPIKRVAAACGFTDGPSFSRFFQRETSLCPSAYRQQFRPSKSEP